MNTIRMALPSINGGERLPPEKNPWVSCYIIAKKNRRKSGIRMYAQIRAIYKKS